MISATVVFAILGGVGVATLGAAWSRRARTAPLKGRPPLGELLKDLPPELAGRYLELFDMDKRIRQTVRSHGLEPVMADQLGKLDYMVASYLRLAQESARMRTHLQASPPGMVEKEAERIRERLAAAPDGEPAMLMRQNLSVVEKRLEKLEQIRSAASRLKLQLDTLEDTVRLIADQALTASAEMGFQVDFDQVIAGVAATDAALAEMRALVGDRSSHAPYGGDRPRVPNEDHLAP